jgi:hypothetical protein
MYVHHGYGVALIGDIHEVTWKFTLHFQNSLYIYYMSLEGMPSCSLCKSSWRISKTSYYDLQVDSCVICMSSCLQALFIFTKFLVLQGYG